MQRVYNDGDVTWYTEYDTLKKTLHMYGVRDLREHFASNAEERKDPNNGFSYSREGGLARKIASVDTIVYREWQREFERIGGKQQANWTADWRKFLMRKLAENPQHYTVERLKNEASDAGHVFIR